MRRPYSLSLAALLAISIAIAWSAAAAADAKTMNTRQRLQKFTDDLKEANEKYILPSQRTVRDQIINDLNTAFTREIRSLQTPKGFTIQKAVDAYLDGLEDMFTLFPTEKQKPSRGNYQRACSQVFKQEVDHAADIANPRTTQDCYNMLMKFVGQGAERFGQERTKEARVEALNGISTMFNTMISGATIPENVDPSIQMAENIKEARNRFPLQTKALEAQNRSIVALLENSAKRIQQKAMTKK